MNNKELKELMSIICEGQDSEQRRKVENFIEYQVQLIDSLDKEIARLNNNINKAIHRIQLIQMDGKVTIRDLTELVNILKGSDKE